MIRTGLGAALLLVALAPMPRLSAQRALLPSDWERPAQSPALAVGADGLVVAAFVSGEEIWCCVSPDEGRRFDAPVLVGKHGKIAAGLSWGPRVAVTPDAIVVTAVHGEQLRGRDGDLYAWRSTDRGRTWTGPVRVNDADGAPREGMHDMAAAPDGRLLNVWLDKVGRGMRLAGAWSDDGGASWSDDQVIYASPDGSICQCCVPEATFRPDGGGAVVLWRNWLDGNRDMYSLELARGDAPATDAAIRLGREHWTLDSCPVSNSGIAVTARDKTFAFWRRESTLYAATPGMDEIVVGQGREAAAAAGPSGVNLLWTDVEGRVRTAARVGSDGTIRGRVLGEGSSVTIAGAPDGFGPVLAAWQVGERGPDALAVVRLADRRAPR
ncbi:MAG: sialidase family protein [Planctomycetota bacterium]